MNLPSLTVLLIVAVALFFAVRAYVRAGRRGGCGSAGGRADACRGCTGAPGCPFCQGK